MNSLKEILLLFGIVQILKVVLADDFVIFLKHVLFKLDVLTWNDLEHWVLFLNVRIDTIILYLKYRVIGDDLSAILLIGHEQQNGTSLIFIVE